MLANIAVLESALTKFSIYIGVIVSISYGT
jgi:hypothetical protein